MAPQLHSFAWAGVLAMALVASSATAQGPTCAPPSPSPDVPSLNAKDGFSGMILVTADKDWMAKWQTTPSTSSVSFGTTRVVRMGQTIEVVTLIANPGLDARGRADVRCRLLVTEPNGRQDPQRPSVPCFTGKLDSGPDKAYLTSQVLRFFAEPSDPVGVYRVDMLLRDAVRGIDLPLRTTFELLPAGR